MHIQNWCTLTKTSAATYCMHFTQTHPITTNSTTIQWYYNITSTYLRVVPKYLMVWLWWSILYTYPWILIIKHQSPILSFNGSFGITKYINSSSLPCSKSVDFNNLSFSQSMNFCNFRCTKSCSGIMYYHG